MNHTIRIITTSDIHGHLYPHSYENGQIRNYGLARIATMLKKLRNENTIFIDNGDVLEGSSLTSRHYLKTPDEVNPITLAMQDLKYDFINIGNHDFNFGEQALKIHLKNVGAPCLTYNVLYKGKHISKPYIIKEVLGKKLAFFAVTTQNVPKWERPENIVNYKFQDAYETAKKIVNKIKKNEKVDYIIGVYHGGLETDINTGLPDGNQDGENQGYRMMKEIEGLDILILGHQHRKQCGVFNGIPYTMPLANGLYLSCIEINTKTNKITPKVLDVDAKPNQAMMDKYLPYEQATQQWLDETIGETKIDLSITDEFDARLHKHQLVTFLNQVQLAASGADLSGVAIFIGADGFKGNITMRDVVNTYHFPNTLVVKKVNGRILRKFLERAVSFWAVKDGKIIVNPEHDFPHPQHYNYDMVDGITYEANISNPIGQRIVSLKYKGKNVKDTDEFTLAVNNYRATGGGDYDMLKEAPTVKEINHSMMDIIAQYIYKHKVIDFKPVNNIKIYAK